MGKYICEMCVCVWRVSEYNMHLRNKDSTSTQMHFWRITYSAYHIRLHFCFTTWTFSHSIRFQHCVRVFVLSIIDCSRTFVEFTQWRQLNFSGFRFQVSARLKIWFRFLFCFPRTTQRFIPDSVAGRFRPERTHVNWHWKWHWYPDKHGHVRDKMKLDKAPLQAENLIYGCPEMSGIAMMEKKSTMQDRPAQNIRFKTAKWFDCS